LLFLGEVRLDSLPALLAAAGAVKPPLQRLRVVLDRLEAWRRFGVLVLAPEEPPEGLLRLAYDLQQAVQPLGLLPERRDYQPHLTLAREFQVQAPEAATPPEFGWTATHFTLFESRKGHYVPLQAWPLYTPEPIRANPFNQIQTPLIDFDRV
jgi:2'-5' RNA ligase